MTDPVAVEKVARVTMKEPKTHTLTTERLRERLNYNPDTGVFTWRTNASHGDYPAGSIAGFSDRDGYLCIKIDGVTHHAHRLAWHHHYGARPVKNIDHLNGVRADNRIANFRLATNNENLQNRKAKAGASSQYVGVSWNKQRGKWFATICVNRTSHRLGFFDNEIDAYNAYLAAKKKYHSFWSSSKISALGATDQ